MREGLGDREKVLNAYFEEKRKYDCMKVQTQNIENGRAFIRAACALI